MSEELLKVAELLLQEALKQLTKRDAMFAAKLAADAAAYIDLAYKYRVK